MCYNLVTTFIVFITQHIQHGTIIFKVMESFRKRRYVNIVENSFTHREFWNLNFRPLEPWEWQIRFVILSETERMVCNLGNVMKNTQRTFMTQIYSIYVFECHRWRLKPMQYLCRGYWIPSLDDCKTCNKEITNLIRNIRWNFNFNYRAHLNLYVRKEISFQMLRRKLVFNCTTYWWHRC